MNTAPEKLPDLIKALGGLHDTTVDKLFWQPNENCLKIEVKDLYSNFRGLAEYKGPTKAEFIFCEVTRLSIEVDLRVAGLRVYDWTLKKDDSSSFLSVISFAPGGRVTVECLRVGLETGGKPFEDSAI